MNDILKIQNQQQVELNKPAELFGGTRSGTNFNPKASAPPQPLFGKAVDNTINENFNKFKNIYDKAPKSYDEIKEAKKQMNIFKQNIQRIKKRNGKSILSPDQLELKKLKITEINALQKKYKDIYEEFFKDQKPKRGRKPKTKA